MIVQITFNKASDHDLDNADLLYKLGATIDESDNHFYIDIETLDDVFLINAKLNNLTDKYWNVLVGTYDKTYKIFIEIDN